MKSRIVSIVVGFLLILSCAHGQIGAGVYNPGVSSGQWQASNSVLAAGIATEALQRAAGDLVVSNAAAAQLAAHTSETARAGHAGGLGLTGADVSVAGGVTNVNLTLVQSNAFAFVQTGPGAWTLVMETNSAGGGGVGWSSVPAATNSAGDPGDMAYTTNYFYVCVGTNLWRRTTLVTWE